MGFFSRQLLKVIEWKDNSSNIIVHRYQMTDREEIMNGCQLVVNESQIAVLTKEGQIADVFGPGTHKLETKNLPILTKIAGWKYGFESPFKADVYYVNTKQFINLTWGTSNPVMMRDKDFGMIRVRAFGKYSFQVEDAPTIIRTLVGSNKDYTTENLKEHLKSLFVSCFSDALATSQIAALDIAIHYEELADELKVKLTDDFKKIGLIPTLVVIENVSLPEEVEKMIDKRTSMGVMDDKMNQYVAFETVGAMREAASNPNGSGLAGAGVGLGAGIGMMNMMNQGMNVQNQQQPQQNTTNCSNCNNPVPVGYNFCPNCGQKMNVNKFCPECGKKIEGDAKFCPGCGKKLA